MGTSRIKMYSVEEEWEEIDSNAVFVSGQHFQKLIKRCKVILKNGKESYTTEDGIMHILIYSK